MESGPSTPLPDKKLLLFILDRLQKCVSLFLCVVFGFFYVAFVFMFTVFCVNFRKDTYGVFSEPVDPEEARFFHFDDA